MFVRKITGNPVILCQPLKSSRFRHAVCKHTSWRKRLDFTQFRHLVKLIFLINSRPPSTPAINVFFKAGPNVELGDMLRHRHSDASKNSIYPNNFSTDR